MSDRSTSRSLRKENLSEHQRSFGIHALVSQLKIGVQLVVAGIQMSVQDILPMWTFHNPFSTRTTCVSCNMCSKRFVWDVVSPW
jgi:hypothetical protein